MSSHLQDNSEHEYGTSSESRLLTGLHLAFNASKFTAVWLDSDSGLAKDESHMKCKLIDTHDSLIYKPFDTDERI